MTFNWAINSNVRVVSLHTVARRSVIAPLTRAVVRESHDHPVKDNVEEFRLKLTWSHDDRLQ